MNQIKNNTIELQEILATVNALPNSGGGTGMEDELITRNFTNFSNDRVTTIGAGAFAQCSSLTSVDFPKATTIGNYAFQNCTSLANVNFPSVTNIGSYAFSYCSALTNVSFPSVTNIGSYAFCYCSKLTSASFNNVRSIGGWAFRNCSSLTNLTLGGSTVCTIFNSAVFTATPIYSKSGNIYVPSALVDTYKTASNWSYFSTIIRAIQ